MKVIEITNKELEIIILALDYEYRTNLPLIKHLDKLTPSAVKSIMDTNNIIKDLMPVLKSKLDDPFAE